MHLYLQRYSNVKVTWKKGAEQITVNLPSRDSYFDSPNYQLPKYIFHIDSQNDNSCFCFKLIIDIRTTTA